MSADASARPRELNGVNSIGNSHTQAKQYHWAALKIKKLGMGRLGRNYKCCFIVFGYAYVCVQVFCWELSISHSFPNFRTVCKWNGCSKALQWGLLKCSKCTTLLIRRSLSSSAKSKGTQQLAFTSPFSCC